MVYLVGGPHAQQQAPSNEELGEARELEAHCADTLACIVDCTVYGLRNDQRLTRPTAELLIATARDAALDLFPGCEATYNLVLAPRFARLLEERFGPAPDRQPAIVLPFRARPQVPAVQIHTPDDEPAAWWLHATES